MRSLCKLGLFCRDSLCDTAHVPDVGPSAGIGQGLGACAAVQRLSDPRLAPGNQQNAQWTLCRRPGAPRRRQYWQGPSASRTVVADRLGHYEGRGWRGFHHHPTLSIAAYGFLVTERIAAGKPAGGKKTSPPARFLRFTRITSLAAARRAQRHVSDSITTIRYQFSFQLIERLGQCPCCQQQNVSQLL